MILSEIDSKVTSLTGASTTSYTAAQKVIDYNLVCENIVGMILDSQDESDYDDPNHGDFPILTVDLVINQRDYGLPVADYLLEVKDVNVTYDGGATWKKAHPIDRSNLSDNVGNDTLLDSQFSKDEPRYDTEGMSFFIYPMLTEGTGQLTARGSRAPYKVTTSDWSTGTKSPGFDSTFHAMVPYGMAREYGVSKRQKALAKDMSDEYSTQEVRLRRQYGRKQKDRNMRLQAEEINYN